MTPRLPSQISAAHWAAVARAAERRDRAERGPAALWYDDADLRGSAVGVARGLFGQSVQAALRAGAPTDELVDAVLAGAPSLDHYEALELIDEAQVDPAVRVHTLLAALYPRSDPGGA